MTVLSLFLTLVLDRYAHKFTEKCDDGYCVFLVLLVGKLLMLINRYNRPTATKISVLPAKYKFFQFHDKNLTRPYSCLKQMKIKILWTMDTATIESLIETRYCENDSFRDNDLLRFTQCRIFVWHQNFLMLIFYTTYEFLSRP